MFSEQYFIDKRDALLMRRAGLAALMDQQMAISHELYAMLDDRLIQLQEVVRLVDPAGFNVVEDKQQKKKHKGMTETELFEHNIEAAMRDRIDPNEPMYCICHRLSHGEMVACENENCPIEWFHFVCVGITGKAPQVWFCSECATDGQLQEEAIHEEL
jgi:hypothetical protein